MVACASDAGRAHAAQVAERTDRDRGVLVEELALAGFPAAGQPRAPFVLVDASAAGSQPRERLAEMGFAVRRGETFPGLGPQWIRITVRDAATSAALHRSIVRLRALPMSGATSSAPEGRPGSTPPPDTPPGFRTAARVGTRAAVRNPGDTNGDAARIPDLRPGATR